MCGEGLRFPLSPHERLAPLLVSALARKLILVPTIHRRRLHRSAAISCLRTCARYTKQCAVSAGGRRAQARVSLVVDWCAHGVLTTTARADMFLLWCRSKCQTFSRITGAKGAFVWTNTLPTYSPLTGDGFPTVSSLRNCGAFGCGIVWCIFLHGIHHYNILLDTRRCSRRLSPAREKME